MTTASLAEQRLLIRGQLRAQRQAIAQQLSPPAIAFQNGYPRSATMRLLMRRPDLLPRLLALIAGASSARAGPAILVVIQILRFAVVGAHARRHLGVALPGRRDAILLKKSSAD